METDDDIFWKLGPDFRLSDEPFESSRLGPLSVSGKDDTSVQSHTADSTVTK